MDKKIDFISGLFPQPTKTDWVKSNIGIKINEFRKELNRLEKLQDERGFVNISLCQSKSGKQYSKVNDYKPDQKEVTASEHSPDRDDLPF